MSDLNVLFVSIDSLRRDMLGAYETPFDWVADLDVATPNLDRFADRAITGTHTYMVPIQEDVPLTITRQRR